MSAPLPSPTERAADREAAEQLFSILDEDAVLLRYQQRTVDKLFTGTALLVIEKSRRIGLTWGLASYCVLRAASHKSAGGQDSWYMGYNLDMAREFIEVCAMWARAFKIAADAIDVELLEGDGEKVQAFRIRIGDHKIVALPSSPRSIRGKQGIVVIDEAAFHKDLDEVIKAAMALRIWGGQVVIVSTHDGVGNPFNTLLDELKAEKRPGEYMTITFDDALADGLYERRAMVAAAKGEEIEPKPDWIAEIKGIYGDNVGEELYCIPKTGTGTLINIYDIAACEHDECGLPDFYTGGLCYVGRDVARRRDGQVQYCMELVGDVLWQRDTYEEMGQTFAHQDAFFNGLFQRRRIATAWVDQTGMGEKVVEDLQLLHGESRVHGELLTGPSRLDLAMSLATRFQEHRIRIRHDPATRADLLAIKKLGSEQSGGLRIVNEGSVHADRFWAYALASRAADLGAQLYEYHGPRSRSGRPGDPGYIHPDDRRPDRGTRFRKAGAW